MSGSVQRYAGYVGPGFPFPNRPIDTVFRLALLSLIADMEAPPALDLAGYTSGIRMGPRLSYLVYMTDFSWVQPTVTPPFNRSARSRSFGMPGIGFWGRIDLAALTGYGAFETAAGTIAPKLRFSAGMGKGGQMDYRTWEAFLEVLSTPERNREGFMFPRLTFEVGYAYYLFNETIDLITPPAVAPSKAEHSVDALSIRATVELPRFY
jgi:hypothetical protein